ncbi:hypothetical protein Bbelb_442630 [Branchiostoma belcheri]|nr:hypothetical protein Bbelb_442630 [Branchiostoma belcheri]
MSYTSSQPVPPWLSGTLRSFEPDMCSRVTWNLVAGPVDRSSALSPFCAQRCLQTGCAALTSAFLGSTKIRVRNAPSQFTVGGRSVSNYFDGFAKLHSLDIDQHSVNFSASFLKTGVYSRSIEANDIHPAPTFMGVDPPFSLLERFRALSNPGDNTIVNVWNFGGDFAALTDAWIFTQFNLDTLGTIGVSVPDPTLGNGGCQTRDIYMSCAHPVVEPGTGHAINFVGKLSFFPGQRDTPFYYDYFRFLTTVELRHSLYYVPDDGMKIYVVNLKTGNVTTLHTDASLYTHHVNAYETGDGRIVTDIVMLSNSKAFTEGLARSRLTNITSIREIQSPTRICRYILDLKTGNVEATPFVSQIPTEDFLNTLDLPVINEKYRTRRYCYVYGSVTSFHSNNPKNVCLPHNDTLWSRPNHYASEPSFVPDPNGTEEDDGVILSSVLDGDRGLNYLLILDARTWRSFPAPLGTSPHYEL